MKLIDRIFLVTVVTFFLSGCGEEHKVVGPTGVAYGYKEFWKDENFNNKPDFGEPYEDQNQNAKYDVSHDFKLYELDPKTGLYKVDENHMPVLFTGTVIARFQGGQPMYERHFKDGIKHGQYLRWSSDGVKVLESSYYMGELHGEYTEWNPHPVDDKKAKITIKPPAKDKEGFPVPRSVSEAISIAENKFANAEPSKQAELKREWIEEQYMNGEFKVYNWAETQALTRAIFKDHPSEESNKWLIHAYKTVANGTFHKKIEAYYDKGVKIEKWIYFDEKGAKTHEVTYENGIVVKSELKQ
jgi:antitoxin component YwqK of YwqJK toxin-antitoxin module